MNDLDLLAIVISVVSIAISLLSLYYSEKAQAAVRAEEEYQRARRLRIMAMDRTDRP